MEIDRVSTPFLGPVHGRIGMVQQFICCPLGAREHHDPNAASAIVLDALGVMRSE